MSSHHKQSLNFDDLGMLDRVLEQAGLAQSSDPVQQDLRMHSMAVLISSFQRGQTTEEALRISLTEQLDVSSSSAGYEIAAKLFSERFRPVQPQKMPDGGFQYGKRIENDGGWTIYHVFSGIPAEFGSWLMIDLDAKTARRALKILNSPEPQH